jgi:hypothetical protein
MNHETGCSPQDQNTVLRCGDDCIERRLDLGVGISADEDSAADCRRLNRGHFPCQRKECLTESGDGDPGFRSVTAEYVVDDVNVGKTPIVQVLAGD